MTYSPIEVLNVLRSSDVKLEIPFGMEKILVGLHAGVVFIGPTENYTLTASINTKRQDSKFPMREARLNTQKGLEVYLQGEGIPEHWHFEIYQRQNEMNPSLTYKELKVDTIF